MRKTPERICMKFSEKIGNGPMNKWLNFGGDPDYRLDTGLFSVFVTIGRYGKWFNRLRCAMLQSRACTSRHRHSNYDVITSPALTEVCTVPVLLVLRWNNVWRRYSAWCFILTVTINDHDHGLKMLHLIEKWKWNWENHSVAVEKRTWIENNN